MKAPKLSVIIPAYNEELYIGACLASVYAQTTKKPYEVIVVDNNSTDGTARIVQKFPTVRLMKEKTQGLAVTRNTGARNAKSDIFVFLDADCTMSPDHLEKIFLQLAQNPDIRCLTGPYIYRDGNLLVRFATEHGQYIRMHFALSRFIFGIQMMLGGNVAFRKKTFATLCGFNESIRGINDPEDLDMAIRCHKKHIKVYFNQSLAVVSSFRRMNRAFFTEAPKRLQYQLRRLLPLLLQRLNHSS